MGWTGARLLLQMLKAGDSSESLGKSLLSHRIKYSFVLPLKILENKIDIRQRDTELS